LAARLARARSLATEQPFSFAMIDCETTVTGVFDAIAHEQDGSCLVIDYKTGAVSDGEDLEALVRRDYELQRLIYALAALRDGAAKVEVAHWYLHRPEQPAVARFAVTEIGDLEARLHSRVAAARARGFAVSDTPHVRLCGTCPGRGGLCSWPADVAMREPPRE
jgi:ATP-dependent helicase/nuclease subunit A